MAFETATKLVGFDFVFVNVSVCRTRIHYVHVTGIQLLSQYSIIYFSKYVQKTWVLDDSSVNYPQTQ